MTAHPASPSLETQPFPVTRIRWWHEAAILGSAMALVLALDLWQLGARSLWRDEIASVVFARAPLGDLLTIIGRDRSVADLANQAAYYLLLHFWLAVGETEGLIRLPSVMFAVATVVPTYALARRLGGWQAGAFAVGILSLLPHAIRYGQEARGYSLAMLVAASLTWLMLVAASRRSTPWPWLAYGLLGAIGLYVHFFVALVIAGHLVWLVATRQLPNRLALAAAAVPLALAVAPLPSVIVHAGPTQEWIPPLSPGQFSSALVDLAGSPWLLLAFIALASLAVATQRRDRGTWLLVASVVLPIGAAAAVSLLKPLFIARYLIVALPAMAALGGLAIAGLKSPSIWLAAVAAMAGLLLLGLPGAYVDIHEQDWRAAGAWMAARAQPGDRMIAGNGMRSIDYYLKRADATVIPSATRVADALAARPPGRIWLVLTETAKASHVPERMASDFTTVAEHAFGDHLTVVLLAARGTVPTG